MMRDTTIAVNTAAAPSTDNSASGPAVFVNDRPSGASTTLIAIIGGAVGGVCCLIGIAGLVVCLLMRRSTRPSRRAVHVQNEYNERRNAAAVDMTYDVGTLQRVDGSSSTSAPRYDTVDSAPRYDTVEDPQGYAEETTGYDRVYVDEQKRYDNVADDERRANPYLPYFGGKTN